jgi:hypothetical protein
MGEAADKDAKKLTNEGMRQTWRGKRLTKSAMKTTMTKGTDPYNNHDAFSKNYKKLFNLRGHKK